MLVKIFNDRQLRVGDGVVDYLIKRMERSFEAAGRIAGALDHAALAGGRNINIPLARQVLEQLNGERKWTSE